MFVNTDGSQAPFGKGFLDPSRQTLLSSLGPGPCWGAHRQLCGGRTGKDPFGPSHVKGSALVSDTGGQGLTLDAVGFDQLCAVREHLPRDVLHLLPLQGRHTPWATGLDTPAQEHPPPL